MLFEKIRKDIESKNKGQIKDKRLFGKKRKLANPLFKRVCE